MRDRIQHDLKEAMRAKDKLRLSVLRMLSSALHNREIEKRSKGAEAKLSDEEILATIRSEIKKRKDASAGFEKGGRMEMAEKEASEAKILEAYLPAELSDEEIKNFVKEAGEKFGSPSADDFGKVMGEVMKKIQGRASGNRVSDAVKKFLEK